MNDDTPMCERHETNYIQSKGYHNRNSHDLFSCQSHYDPNDFEKSLTELNNDVKNDLEDFKRRIRSMRTIQWKLFARDDGKTIGVLPNKESKTVNQEPQSKPDFEKSITKFLDGQRVTNMFFKNNVNDMILKMKQNEKNFQTKIKNMERKIDEWSKSQNVSSEQTDRTDPPPPPAQTEHVNVVFTGRGKSDDSLKIQKDPPPPIIINNKTENDKPIKTSKKGYQVVKTNEYPFRSASTASYWLDMTVVRFHCPFVGLSGCHDGGGNGLTKTSLITHLRGRHCNGDAQAITRKSLSTNLAVFEEAEGSDFVSPPDCGDGVVRFVLYDIIKPHVPSSSEQLDHVDDLVQVQHGGFTLALLDSLFSKGLCTVKSIPPKCRLGFSRVLKEALDKVICTPDDISCWVSLLVLPLCLLKTFRPRSNLECKSAIKRQRQEESIVNAIRSWSLPGGSLQVMRETLAESSPLLSDVDEEDIDMGERNIKHPSHHPSSLHTLLPFNPTILACNAHHHSCHESPKIAWTLSKTPNLGTKAF
ncbi:hypothetical protein Tco_0842689 [Tanacetum coccineum]|uniref:Uncharacterized protein n=1 Tax=Tanacetum coccineum TaxID=301880 RepID=A0ABQ5B2P3_9ASTR